MSHETSRTASVPFSVVTEDAGRAHIASEISVDEDIMAPYFLAPWLLAELEAMSLPDRADRVAYLRRVADEIASRPMPRVGVDEGET